METEEIESCSGQQLLLGKSGGGAYSDHEAMSRHKSVDHESKIREVLQQE